MTTPSVGGLSNAVLAQLFTEVVPGATAVKALRDTDGHSVNDVVAALLDVAYGPGLGHAVPTHLKLHTAGNYAVRPATGEHTHVFPYLAEAWNQGKAATDTDALVEPLRVLLRASPHVRAVQTVNNDVMGAASSGQPELRAALNRALHTYMTQYIAARDDRGEFFATKPAANRTFDTLRGLMSTPSRAAAARRAQDLVQADVTAGLAQLRAKLPGEDMAVVDKLVADLEYLALVGSSAAHVQTRQAGELSDFMRRARDAHLLGLQVVSDGSTVMGGTAGAGADADDDVATVTSLGGQAHTRLLSATILAQSPLLNTVLEFNAAGLNQDQKRKVVQVYDYVCDTFPYVGHAKFTEHLRNLLTTRVGEGVVDKLRGAGFVL